MKFNWINLLAALLILTGVYLLVVKKHQAVHQTAGTTTRPMTEDEIRQHFYASFEKTLGRPLSDIEKQMITITHDSKSAQAQLSEPLLSRVAMAERQRKAMELSNSANPVAPIDSANNLAPAATMPVVPSMR